MVTTGRDNRETLTIILSTSHGHHRKGQTKRGDTHHGQRGERDIQGQHPVNFTGSPQEETATNRKTDIQGQYPVNCTASPQEETGRQRGDAPHMTRGERYTRTTS